MVCWLDSYRIEFPSNREIGIRLVRAEGARLYASRQTIPQRTIALRDSVQYRLDRLGDALSGSFRSGRSPPITSTEPPGPRECRGQCIDLLFGVFGALDVPQLLGFFQFFAPLGEPAPVSDLGLVVEHLACVTQTGDMNACLFEVVVPARQGLHGMIGFIVLAPACDSAYQI